MSKKLSRTYKLGKFSITFFSNEIVIFFLGKKKIYAKTLYITPSAILKKLVLPLIIIAAVSLMTVSFLNFDTSTVGDNEITEDDKLKDSLLLSEQTDYSEPEKHEKLVIKEHRVQQGENLSKIAEQYGISIDTICGSNNLRSYDFIRAGILLKIPNKDGLLYKMQKGSKIVDIAKKYKVSLQNIIVENNIKNPDFIAVDRVLFIPDAKPQNIVVGFMWPCQTKRVTCGYGWRRDPFDRSHKEFHKGLDIGARFQWVRASKYGKVTYTGWMGGYGNAIIIAHPGGMKTLYAHLSRIIVRPGQYVKQGQTIAKSGNTGRSTGPHLHFEIINKGRHKNPYYYLKRRRQ